MILIKDVKLLEILIMKSRQKAPMGRRIILMIWLSIATHSGLSIFDGATHPAAMRHPSPRGDGAAALH